MARANSGSAMACAERVVTGIRPRASLCTPCAPPSNRADAALDAEFDRLVVAGFEMQTGDVDVRSPVAAPERRGAENIQSRADTLALVFSEHEQNIVGKRLADPHEKVQGQVRRGMVLTVGLGVAMKKKSQSAGSISCPTSRRNEIRAAASLRRSWRMFLRLA